MWVNSLIGFFFITHSSHQNTKPAAQNTLAKCLQPRVPFF
jgi:hypothetical protein